MNKLSINYTPNALTLSSFSGLKIFDDLVQKFEIKHLVGIHLPQKERERGFSSWNKFYALILGFIAGFDCLDDFDWFGEDPIFLKLTNSPSSITLGNFLRSFKPRKIEILQELLSSFGLAMRKSLEPNVQKIILTIDSSDHEQFGIKSEGVDFGYRKFRCLNTQNIFDEKGICYGFKLRKGNTHSAADAPETLYTALKSIPNHIKKKFRADSAYSLCEIYNTCLNQNCNFVICLKENVWASVLTQNRRHIKWQKTKLQFFESDKCEIGSCLYPLKGLAGIIAYNLMRYASFAIKENGCFVKTTRKKLMTIAGEVITHGRRLEVRIMEYVYREVELVIKKMNFVRVDASRFKRGKFPGLKT